MKLHVFLVFIAGTFVSCKMQNTDNDLQPRSCEKGGKWTKIDWERYYKTLWKRERER